MVIATSRFGSISVDETRFIRFEKGILGFPHQHGFALIQTGENSVFDWLQAVDRPELAFVVCDPRLRVPEYQAPIRAEEMTTLRLEGLSDAQVFVIVNKVDDVLTGNLQGPLVVNVRTREGMQLVLSERRYSTRHPLMTLPRKEAAAASLSA
jgi:flagellar assembly factor FliW